MNTTFRLLSRQAAVLLIAAGLAGCRSPDDQSAEGDDGSKTEIATSTATPNMLSADEAAVGWRLLFDGVSTDGWRAYNAEDFPTVGWRVENGELIVEHSGTEEEGLGGDIVTEEAFANFELTVDFLITDTSNSGIFYRVIENEDQSIWNNAPEYQILDDETYIAMGGMNMDTHLTGDNYDLHSAGERPSRPVGEWNTARILVDGPHVEHWLNGVMTVEYELWSPDWEARVAASKFAEFPAYGRTQRGLIGLQDHGHMVKFRNIKIRPLPASS